MVAAHHRCAGQCNGHPTATQPVQAVQQQAAAWKFACRRGRLAVLAAVAVDGSSCCPQPTDSKASACCMCLLAAGTRTPAQAANRTQASFSRQLRESRCRRVSLHQLTSLLSDTSVVPAFSAATSSRVLTCSPMVPTARMPSQASPPANLQWVVVVMCVRSGTHMQTGSQTNWDPAETGHSQGLGAGSCLRGLPSQLQAASPEASRQEGGDWVCAVATHPGLAFGGALHAARDTAAGGRLLLGYRHCCRLLRLLWCCCW